MINKQCCKLTQKEYNSRYDWAEKVIIKELIKKFNFDHTIKWYMHKPESVLENMDFVIQTDPSSEFCHSYKLQCENKRNTWILPQK